MRKVRLMITAAALLALLAFAQGASAAVALGDGGFELGTPNPHWREKSTHGYTLIKDEPFARTGMRFARLGGAAGSGEVSKISQDITLPRNGTATLTFWLRIPAYDPAGSDKLLVSMDSDRLLKITETNGGDYASYQPVRIPIDAYLDGGTHTLTIKGTDKAGGNTAWYIDDVAISFDCTTNGGMESDSNGDNVPDRWKITSPSGQTRRVCGFAYDGACSVRLQGSTGSPEKLTYVYKAAATGKAGDTFMLMVAVYGTGFTPADQWGVRIEAYNTDGTLTVLEESSLNNTMGWDLSFVTGITAPKDYKKIRITVWHPGSTAGVAYVDNLFMPASGSPPP